MAVRKQIYVWFFIGEPIFLYSPKIFGKLSIVEDQVMKIIMTSAGLTYVTSSGYYFRDSDVSEFVFSSYEAAANRRKEVMNEDY